MYKFELVQECAELVQLVISKHERSGNQKMECTLEETEIVVLFNEPDVLNLYKRVLNLYKFSVGSVALWLCGLLTCVNICLLFSVPWS